jgi:lipopolysaccharide export system ATP-binding protein
MPLLSVEGLVKNYGRRRVVDGVDFHVETGEIVGLLGPNGAGKTTSFRMTCGMVIPDSGRVLLDDAEITDWPRSRACSASSPSSRPCWRSWNWWA